jgi:uncharacterized protein (TIGR02145 family)
MNKLAISALTAVLGFAITFTLNACEEKGGGSTFTDTRDNKTYKTVKIGEQVWMAENLNFEAKGSTCYDNKPDNCKKYGRLYKLETAKTACPSGWHLPNDTDWDKLFLYIDGKKERETTEPYSKTAGKLLKSKSGWNENGNGTDNYGFAALPSGNGNEDGSFFGLGSHSGWLSSDEGVSQLSYNEESIGISLFANWESDGMSTPFSIRCIQGDAKATAPTAAEKAKANAEAAAARAALEAAVAEASAVCNVKQPETIKGNPTKKFEYDKQNRIIKIDDETITYADNLITVGANTTVTQKYVINGSTVTKVIVYVRDGSTSDGGILTMDKDGYIVKKVGYGWSYTYEYKDGNLTGVVGHSDDERYSQVNYSYDNKKSPFSGSNTPKWLLQDLLNSHYASNNNILEWSWEGEVTGTTAITYKYDSDGFPTKQTNKTETEGNEFTETNLFTYCGTKN